VAKTFKLQASQIRPLAPGRGSCFATDMITVQGLGVGFMYREAPDNDLDSGWRFLAGVETQEYLDVAANLELHDVNTIANYDPGVIPLLDAPAGSAFARDESGAFVEVEPPG